jgi:hypothetical protein
MPNVIEVVVLGKDQASKVLKGVGGAIAGIGTVATAAAAVSGAALLGIGAAVTKMTLDAAAVEGTRNTFKNLAEDIGTTADVMTEDLRRATRGMVKDADLWAASNKFVAMGISDTAESTAELAKMATQLGMAMGEDATASMENFALMMANQSIPRLDSFGISSGAVRARIEELQAATADLSREEAFKIAVMEQGAIAMERVGEQSGTAAATINQIRAIFANTKEEIGRGFLPVLNTLAISLRDMAEKYGPTVIEWAGVASEWLGEKLPIAIDWLSAKWSEYWPQARGALQSFWAVAKPAFVWLGDTFKSFTENLLPGLQAAWNILKEGWEEISEIYRVELKPNLDELWKALGIGETASLDIGKAVGMFLGWLLKISASGVIEYIKMGLNLMAASMRAGEVAANAIRGAIHSAHDAFDRIARIIGHVKGMFIEFRDAVNSFQLPWWLRPGSPTPLEMGLVGIGRALSDVQSLSGRGLGFGGGNNYSQTTNQSQSFNMNVYTNAGAQAVHQGFQTMAALS